MGNYHIRYDEVLSQANLMRQTANTLADLEDRLAAVAHAMDGRDSHMASLKNQVANSSRKAAEAAERLKIFGMTAEDIHHTYQHAERNCRAMFDTGLVFDGAIDDFINSQDGVVFPKKEKTWLEDLGGTIVTGATGVVNGIGGVMDDVGDTIHEGIAGAVDAVGDAARSVGEAAYDLGSEAVQNFAQGVSVIKQSIEPDGSMYQAWTIGKCVVGVTVGTIALTAAIASVPATGPAGVLAAIYSGNEVVNSMADYYNALEGKYDQISQTNYLKDTLEESSVILTGSDDLGEAWYSAGEILNIVSTAGNTLDGLKDINGISFSHLGSQADDVGAFVIDTLNTNVDLNTLERISYQQKLLSFQIPDLTNLTKGAEASYSLLKSLGNVFTNSYQTTTAIIMD